jgi:group I intron endonuclease
MFIYLITNVVSGKVYVGQTVGSVHRRWQHHKYAASGKRKHHFLNAIRKYGAESFKVETLCECPTREALNETERFYVWLLAAHLPSFGYNGDMGGSNGVPTDKTRQKMRDSQLGRKHTPETRMKIAEANRRRVWSEDSKKKSSLSHTGKILPPRTEEYRKAVSDRQKDKHFSESRRLAISKSLKGRKHTAEAIVNFKKAAAIRKNNPPTPAELSLWKSRKGKPGKSGWKWSEESKAKQSASLKLAWARRKNALLSGL